MTSPSLRDPKLAVLYQNTPGAVAFVDESYRAHPLGPERAFYSMSAVTFAKDQLDHVREVLTDIAGGRYWHTTEANAAGRHTDIARMTRFLARESQWNILTVEASVAPGDSDLRAARATCLAALSREVQRGQGPGAVRLIVADNNLANQVNHDDQRVLNQLRSIGDVDPDVALYHGRMAHEPLLWAADVVSWSAYRNLAIDDGRWIEPLRDVLTVLDARTGIPLNMKQPQAAAATPRAQQSTPRGPQTAVAFIASLPGGRTVAPGTAGAFGRGTSVLDDLTVRVAQLRRDAGARGITEGNTPHALAVRAQRPRVVHVSTPATPPAVRVPGPQI